MMDTPLPVRRSARLLIVSPDRRLLLFRYDDEHGDDFWATPGGELVGDETFRDAAARELLEETGQRLSVGDVVREREAVYPVARSGPARWIEQYFLVSAPDAFVPLSTDWTDEERETIVDHRWWSVEDLARSRHMLKPAWLADVLSALRPRTSGSQAREHTVR